MPGLDAERRLQTVCLLVLTTFAIAGALYWLSTVMIPFVLAVFLSFAINPVVGLLTRKARLPRSIAILVVFLFGFLLLPLIGALVSSSARQLTDNADGVTIRWTCRYQTTGKITTQHYRIVHKDTFFGLMRE